MTMSFADEKPTPIELPERIKRLDELAHNLWWTWNGTGREMFRQLSPARWHIVNHNPVRLLRDLEWERLEEAANDPRFLALYDATLKEFDEAMTTQDTWVARHAPELADKTLAYFSAEFGLHPTLPIYSGGLGVLAGDHLKSASDLGLKAVAVSLLYRQGYLRQRLDASGWQQDVTADFGPDDEPTTLVRDADGNPVMVEIDFAGGGGPLRLQIWRVMVGRVALYLLDSDVAGNPDWTRTISSRLYGGDREHRLRQEIILGIGGVRALRALGIAPDYWHANEGHAALHLLERVREEVARGATFEEAAQEVREHTVFTSHTPVPAGHDVFSEELIDRYFWSYWPQLGLDRDAFYALAYDGHHPGFNLTALSLRLANYRNGVSERHGDVTREMWHQIWPNTSPSEAPITSITNGVHLATWISRRIALLLDRYLDADWRERVEDPKVWEKVYDIPLEEFWAAHLDDKQDLFDFVIERIRSRWLHGSFEPNQVIASGPFLDQKALTLGFARRFATYKRATLLFHDPDRLARILNDLERPVQIIFAGKAHPADDGGKRLIQQIYHYAQDPRFGGRIAFAEDYDMQLARGLVSGVDVWLNNPRAPLEASGTSGMKASANGVPNVSILDGWWLEGYQENPRNGWAIPSSSGLPHEQDAIDAEAMYRTLEEQVIPLYYKRNAEGLPEEWIKVCLEAIRTVAPNFSSQRMVIEYIRQLYVPAALGRVPVS